MSVIEKITGTSVLVTGGAGFVGTNLCDHLATRGHRVVAFDDLSRPGVRANAEWLSRRHGGRIDVRIADVRDAAALRRAMKGIDVVFHFAAQVAVTTSLVLPAEDFAINAAGTVNVLEAARAMPRPPAVIYTSTNKVYGNLEDVELVAAGTRWLPVHQELRQHGIAEDRALCFCSPYGCSKGAADQYVLDYGRSFDLPLTVFRMSCIYGPHQCGSEHQGWVAHFLAEGRRGRPITICGDGKQVRDALWIGDLVEALEIAMQRRDLVAGQVFNLGGGPENAISLLELVAAMVEHQGRRPLLRHDDWRVGDQRWYASDTRRFRELTGWRPRVGVREGIARLDRWIGRAASLPAAGVDAIARAVQR